jgi:hypothetical protein
MAVFLTISQVKQQLYPWVYDSRKELVGVADVHFEIDLTKGLPLRISNLVRVYHAKPRISFRLA